MQPLSEKTKNVFLESLDTDGEVKTEITAAVESITKETLAAVRENLSHHLRMVWICNELCLYTNTECDTWIKLKF